MVFDELLAGRANLVSFGGFALTWRQADVLCVRMREHFLCLLSEHITISVEVKSSIDGSMPSATEGCTVPAAQARCNRCCYKMMLILERRSITDCIRYAVFQIALMLTCSLHPALAFELFRESDSSLVSKLPLLLFP